MYLFFLGNFLIFGINYLPEIKWKYKPSASRYTLHVYSMCVSAVERVVKHKWTTSVRYMKAIFFSLHQCCWSGRIFMTICVREWTSWSAKYNHIINPLMVNCWVVVKCCIQCSCRLYTIAHQQRFVCVFLFVYCFNSLSSRSSPLLYTIESRQINADEKFVA